MSAATDVLSVFAPCVVSVFVLSLAWRRQAASAAWSRVAGFDARIPDADRNGDLVDAVGESLGIGRSQARVVIVVVGAGTGMAVVMGATEPTLAALILMITIGSVVALVRRCRRIERSRLVDQLPDGLESIARSLHSGMSMSQALGEAIEQTDGPVAVWLRSILASASRGITVDSAASRHEGSSPEVRIAATAISMAASAGGRPALAIDGVSRSLRDRSAVRREIDALTSQAFVSMIVLAVLPVGFVAVSAGVDPTSLRFLIDDNLGRLCLIAGLSLDVVGIVWMRALVGRLA